MQKASSVCDDNDAHGTDTTESAPETELEICQIKENTVQKASSVCDDNNADTTTHCTEPIVQNVCDDNHADTSTSVKCKPMVQNVCDDNDTDTTTSVMCKLTVNQDIYEGETDIETEIFDENTSVVPSQGMLDGNVEPNTNIQEVSAENTNIQDISAENTNNQEVSDENSMDVSVDFKKYKDQLMSLSQELSDLTQNSLHKVNSQQPINIKMCDFLELCGMEFHELGRLLITVSKDIKKAYEANVEKQPCIKRKSNGMYACSACGKQFMLRSSCYNHLKIHTITRYFCTKQECDYSCKSESTFKEHMKYYHLTTKTIKCKSK